MYLRGDKLTLVKSTLSSLPTYFLFLLPIPVKVAKRMEIVQRDFLSSGIGNNPKTTPMKWSKLCKPVQHGRVGIQSLRRSKFSFVKQMVVKIWNGERCLVEEGYRGKIWE